jgi:hypothetical protein
LNRDWLAKQQSRSLGGLINLSPWVEASHRAVHALNSRQDGCFARQADPISQDVLALIQVKISHGFCGDFQCVSGDLVWLHRPDQQRPAEPLPVQLYVSFSADDCMDHPQARLAILAWL